MADWKVPVVGRLWACAVAREQAAARRARAGDVRDFMKSGD
jgi:hypothetical protein